MKKIIHILIVGILLVSCAAAIGIGRESDVSTTSVHVTFTKPMMKQTTMDNQTFVEMLIDRPFGTLHHAGEPLLPRQVETFELPFGTKITDISCDVKGMQSFSLSQKILPAPEPVIIGMEAEPVFTMNKEIYQLDEFYPNDWCKISTGGGLNGDNEQKTFVTVQTFPARYNPVDNVVLYVEEITVSIQYKEPKEFLLSANDEFDMVIIAPDCFSSDLQPLINHKNSYSVRTIFKSTEEIYIEYEGRDHQEQIKYFIKDAIETWNIRYVLIIGSIDKVPIRMAGISMPGYYNQLPTDLYYANIYDADMNFCSLYTNNDDVSSEVNFPTCPIIDEVDLYPDVHIGRIPCRNNRDLNTVINKIISYETQTYGADWFNRLILLAGDTFPYEGLYEGEVVTYHIEQHMQDFDSIRIWASLNNYNPRSINKEFSKGAGFVSYSGHGFECGFGTYPPNEENMIKYYSPFIIGINNGDKLPIVFFGACSTAWLDYNIYGIKLPCIAWSFVKKQSGGAIASIGSTRHAYAMINESGPQSGCARLNLEFFKSYEPGIRLGEMLTSAKIDYINLDWKDYLTMEQFTLIGDPSLKIGGYQ